MFVRIAFVSLLLLPSNAASVKSATRSASQGLLARAKEVGSSYTSTQGAVSGDAWAPVFYAPQLTPVQFLFISSPSLGKVVYTELKNFKAKYGRTYALVDSGLTEPCGLAFDQDRGHLYVADKGASAIYRYTVLVNKGEARDGSKLYTLSTDGIRLTIMSGHPVEWVAVTRAGNVFYSDQGSKSINKINSDVMDALSDGTFQPEALVVVSEKEQEAQASVQASAAMSSSQPLVTEAPAAVPQILSIYEGSVNPHVTTPSGLASDGLRLYWGNQETGTTVGSCVEGQVNPVAPPVLAQGTQPAPFPATAVSTVTDIAYGVAKTSSMLFFSSSGTSAGGVVYGVPQTGGNAYTFAMGLGEPRGLAWDGDQTVFVADKAGNAVYSFPSGRLMESAPLTKAVEFEGAFGVALLSEADPAFNNGSAMRAPGTVFMALLLFALTSAAWAE